MFDYFFVSTLLILQSQDSWPFSTCSRRIKLSIVLLPPNLPRFVLCIDPTAFHHFITYQHLILPTVLNGAQHAPILLINLICTAIWPYGSDDIYAGMSNHQCAMIRKKSLKTNISFGFYTSIYENAYFEFDTLFQHPYEILTFNLSVSDKVSKL